MKPVPRSLADCRAELAARLEAATTDEQRRERVAYWWAGEERQRAARERQRQATAHRYGRHSAAPNPACEPCAVRLYMEARLAAQPEQEPPRSAWR